MLCNHLGYKGKIASIDSSGARKITITLKNRISANKLKSDTSFAQSNLRFSIPYFRLNRQGIIREVPSDLDTDELQREIVCPDDIKTLNVQRLNRRSPTDDSKLIPTSTILLTFLGQYKPHYVFLYYANYQVDTYTPSSLRQCFKCFRYGHLQAQCKSKELCEHCGKLAHEKGPRREINSPSCVNCNGSHSPRSKSCPE